MSSIERAERRRERQAGLARLVSKLRQAENAVLRDSIWELVSITRLYYISVYHVTNHQISNKYINLINLREHEQKMPNGEKAFVTKEILRLRNVSSCDQPTFLLFPKPLNCRYWLLRKVSEPIAFSEKQEQWKNQPPPPNIPMAPGNPPETQDFLARPCFSPCQRSLHIQNLVLREGGFTFFRFSTIL